MASLEAASSIDDDPLFTVFVGEMGFNYNLRRSRLSEYSGFFRRMFSHDWVENRENRVTLMDDFMALQLLVYCIQEGGMISVPDVMMNWDLEYPTEPHTLTIELYRLMDKYDCEDFKSDCRDALARYARPLLDTWTAGEFMKEHVEVLEATNAGKYPEDMYHVLAEAWRVFATRIQPCAQLDAMIADNPKISLAVAKCYRVKLVRGIKAMKTMEGIEELEVDEDPEVE